MCGASDTCPVGALGVIDLKDCIEVVDQRPMRGYDHVFDLCTDKRAYHFAAPSMEMKNVWMESLTAVLRNKTEVINLLYIPTLLVISEVLMMLNAVLTDFKSE